MINSWPWLKNEPLEWELILKQDVLNIILSHYPDFDPSQIEIKEISFDNQIILFYYSWEKYACSTYFYKDYVKFIDEIRRKIDESIQKK